MAALLAPHCAEQAARSYLKAVRTAFKEVSDGLISLEKLREFRRIQEERVAVLTDQASLSQARYKGGVTSYLEVLDSERQLFEGEQSLVSARLDEVSAVGFLFRALGGGWESLAKEAPADSGDSATAASEDNPTPPLRTAEAASTTTD